MRRPTWVRYREPATCEAADCSAPAAHGPAVEAEAEAETEVER